MVMACEGRQRSHIGEPMPQHRPERSHEAYSDAGGWITTNMVITTAIFVLVIAAVFGALVLML